MRKFTIIAMLALLLTGCGRFSPLSPQIEEDIQNQGQIDEIKNNQNGLMAEILSLKQQNLATAEDLENFQQGLINLKGNSNNNTGTQILQGDGPLVAIFGVAVIFLILHYRTKAIKSEKTAEIFAQQMALYNDTDLEGKVFLAAAHTDVESDVYNIMVKAQSHAGR